MTINIALLSRDFPHTVLNPAVSHWAYLREQVQTQCWAVSISQRPLRLFHIELWTDHHVVHRRDLAMEIHLRILQKAITWPLHPCTILLDTFYWLHNYITHTKRPNRQCWRFFEPKSPKSRSLIKSLEIVENLMFRPLKKYFLVEKIFFNSLRNKARLVLAENGLENSIVSSVKKE